MTDDLIPDDSEPGAAARDEALAARLAVPPLDDLTRRRLVRGALTAAPAAGPGRRVPWWTVAAAAVLVAVAVTAAALAVGGGSGSGDRPTAAAPKTAPETPPKTEAEGGSGSAASAPPSADQRLAVPSAPQSGAGAGSLGDLGEVANRDTLRTRVTAAQRSFSADRGADGTGSASTGVAGTVPCATALAAAQPGLGPPLASGTATFHGAPATVVTTRNRAGDLVAVVVVDAGCEVKAPVTIGP
jgi:hypothetical protein